MACKPFCLGWRRPHAGAGRWVMSHDEPAAVGAKRWFRFSKIAVEHDGSGIGFGIAVFCPIAQFRAIAGVSSRVRRLHRDFHADFKLNVKSLACLGINK